MRLLTCLLLPAFAAALSFSAGFSSDAVLQRSKTTGAAIYGFAHSAGAISVAVAGTSGHGDAVAYKVAAAVAPWTDDTGCNATACVDSKTPVPPAHGGFVWRALLQPHAAGGELTVTVTAASASEPNATRTLERLTMGDVYYCGGQSNMALQTYYTFSAVSLRAEIKAGKYSKLRHFMMGDMSHHFESLAPQWVTSWNSLSAGPQYTWHNVTSSAAVPLRIPAATSHDHVAHSAFSQFSATCMYFGVELIDARAAAGLEDVPIGLIQSAIGGSQIEAWMSNETLSTCTEQSTTTGGGGALPDGSDHGQLYYGMTAPFANYSVAGWLWYQGENNCHGTMGNSQDGTGYGCSLPAMIKGWRSVWRAPENALFGVATLAAGGSEGAGQHMGGMRWSQTANWGSWPNPSMPHSFGAQVYDLGDPWSHLGDGNPRMTNQTTGNVVEPEVLKCCFAPQPNASGHTTPNGCPNSTSKDPSMHKSCPDPLNCSLPDPSTGKYGSKCLPWADLTWGAKLKPLAPLIRANSPSGVPGVNFMGGT